MGVSKSDRIIIVGSGAFGLSTGLHLINAGYTDISVFDKDEEVPSRYSAANDLNKIVRAEYEDQFYKDLTMKAIRAWQTPLFAPHFHQVGFLNAVSGQAPVEAWDTLNRFRASAEQDPVMTKYMVDIQSPEDVKREVWQFNQGELPGWKGYLNKWDGYAHSGNSLRTIHRVAAARGVRFFLGKQGAVSEIVYEKSSQGRKAAGIKTKDGKVHSAKLVIVAAGAAASRLVPEIGQQLVAKSWSVAHVLLNEEETSALRGIPVTYARDLGFFFEPDPVTRLLKLCPMGGGYINTDPETGVSHSPDTVEESTGFIPDHDEVKLRKLLKQTLPYLADRPLVRKSLCWFADTQDTDFIIDYVPETSSSVLILSGDSGHGFKMFPIFGEWTKSLIEAPEGKQSEARWRWKAPKKEAEGGNWGDDVSWRLGQTLELVDIKPEPKSRL